MTPSVCLFVKKHSFARVISGRSCTNGAFLERSSYFSGFISVYEDTSYKAVFLPNTHME